MRAFTRREIAISHLSPHQGCGAHQGSGRVVCPLRRNVKSRSHISPRTKVAACVLAACVLVLVAARAVRRALVMRHRRAASGLSDGIRTARPTGGQMSK